MSEVRARARARFLPPDDGNPPCCDECEEDRDDCGFECEKMAKFLRDRDEDIRQAETDHPLHDREDRGLDERWEREI